MRNANSKYLICGQKQVLLGLLCSLYDSIRLLQFLMRFINLLAAFIVLYLNKLVLYATYRVDGFKKEWNV